MFLFFVLGCCPRGTIRNWESSSDNSKEELINLRLPPLRHENIHPADNLIEKMSPPLIFPEIVVKGAVENYMLLIFDHTQIT
jgi:hypothetical protein